MHLSGNGLSRSKPSHLVGLHCPKKLNFDREQARDSKVASTINSDVLKFVQNVGAQVTGNSLY